MKKSAIGNILVRPYTSAEAIDRDGYLTGTLGIKVAAPTGSPTAAKLTVTITHCDTSGGSYTAVSDKAAVIGKTLSDAGALELTVDHTASTGGLAAMLHIDMAGLKRYVKITGAVSFTGGSSPAAAATYALCLSDPRKAPVQ